MLRRQKPATWAQLRVREPQEHSWWGNLREEELSCAKPDPRARQEAAGRTRDKERPWVGHGLCLQEITTHTLSGTDTQPSGQATAVFFFFFLKMYLLI